MKAVQHRVLVIAKRLKVAIAYTTVEWLLIQIGNIG